MSTIMCRQFLTRRAKGSDCKSPRFPYALNPRESRFPVRPPRVARSSPVVSHRRRRAGGGGHRLSSFATRVGAQSAGLGDARHLVAGGLAEFPVVPFHAALFREDATHRTGGGDRARL